MKKKQKMPLRGLVLSAMLCLPVLSAGVWADGFATDTENHVLRFGLCADRHHAQV